jgi:Histidine kinase-, DNA gyrase B-, and HSP90-like ATPase
MPTSNLKLTSLQPRVSIRPGVGILSVLRHLNYKAWFAMAEFVDNSLQSYLQNREKLQELHGKDFRLNVEIEIERSDEIRIKIRDNAAGIAIGDYARAFRPAELPADRSGLAEFGMGMKSAACWFAPRWRVRTSALGEPVERTITLDIDTIVRDDIEELDVVEAPAAVDDHFTEITLIDPYDKLQTKTGSKIKDHLASIYRIFLREQTMELWFNRESLSYEIPKILVAPYYKTPTDAPLRWLREFGFDFGLGLRASGFAALREVASTSTAGFALFRRNRLIEGSLDEPYRPEFIFGTGNSYRKQRLIGEIHLEGFDVSHTKDGFKWEDHEQPFLELLHEELETQALPLLSQAEGYRARLAQRELKAEAEKASARVAETLQKEAPRVLEQQSAAKPFLERLPESVPPDQSASSRVIDVSHRGAKWRITIELAMDPAVEDWLTVTDKPSSRGAPREITVRMSLVHPFMQQFCRADSAEIEALARVAAALGLAEITARDAGVPQYGTIRRNLNQLLREAFSKP